MSHEVEFAAPCTFVDTHTIHTHTRTKQMCYFIISFVILFNFASFELWDKMRHYQNYIRAINPTLHNFIHGIYLLILVVRTNISPITTRVN